MDDVHLTEPGLLVLDITAPDEETACAAIRELEQLWHTSGAAPVQRLPGKAGVVARVYADLRPAEAAMPEGLDVEPPRQDGGGLPGRRMRVVAKGGRLTAKGSVGLQPNDLPHGQWVEPGDTVPSAATIHPTRPHAQLFPYSHTQ
ncbi:DUF6207 family protein [Streptomyces sp. DW26H14]|uniref:DUF6207 family protein n=1 Tax=Streptomyces sp. DW26H14 TaxID=3435395 RepID=UPI00403DB8D3